MAYMDQQKKSKIATELKKVIPTDWKYSISVKHYSTIVLTISAAPIDLIALNLRKDKDATHLSPNQYYLEREFDGKLLKTFEAIKAAMNLDNYDHSDVQSDHFDVGHYIDINIGRWDKPFQVLARAA